MIGVRRSSSTSSGAVNGNIVVYSIAFNNIFIFYISRYGRDNLPLIASLIKSKSLQKVEEYSQAFWQRLPNFSEHEKILKTIEKGEASIQDSIKTGSLLNDKFHSYKDPKQDFRFTTSYYSKFKDRFYTAMHDRILLFCTF